MCETLFERVHALHISTQDPLFSTNRDKTLRALSNRLYKFEQYARKINSGVRQDTTAKALIVAYIMGSRAIAQRRQATFATMDTSLDADEQFYNGLWDLLCERYAPESATIAPMPPLDERAMQMLLQDPDVLRYDIRNICDEYVTFSILNDYPYKARSKASALMNLPRNWVSGHYMRQDQDNRTEPVDRLLQFMFGLFRQDFLCKPAPSDIFWNQNAYITWQRLHYVLRADLDRAEQVHNDYVKEDTGADKKPRETGRKGLGIII